MAIVGYRVIISQGSEILHEVTEAWPEDDDPNPYLSQILEDWEAERGEFANGIIVISFEMIC